MFADSRVIVLSDAQPRWRRSTELSEEELLFDATKPWRMRMNAEVRDYVRDAAAEIDAFVWQQIASGERDMAALHSGAVTCVRRIKRRALRYRERESPLTVGVEDVWHCVDDFAPDVVERLAASQLVSCLPEPNGEARVWLDRVTSDVRRGELPPMSSRTKMAGRRWARSAREQIERSL